MRHVFIIGSKGIPARYGGFETFVDSLARLRADPELVYHVSVWDGQPGEYDVYGARCFGVKVPPIGPARAIWCDIAALARVVRIIRAQRIERAVVYVLTCRIGPFFGHFVRQLHRLGATVALNPDGHEWMRGRWSQPVRAYWRMSEGQMVRQADLVVCDSRAIEAYVCQAYAAHAPKTTFIAYGVDAEPAAQAETARQADAAYADWRARQGVEAGEYYLMVGRFVPENNLMTILREFVASDTRRKLVVIANNEENRFMRELREQTGFDRDSRILFAGTVYDAALLVRIRAGALAYLHGHEVGGTNPSLLEALAMTPVNLLLDVPFNREVGEEAALYFTKQPGDLRARMAQTEAMSAAERAALGEKARARIEAAYRAKDINARYEALWRELHAQC